MPCTVKTGNACKVVAHDCSLGVIHQGIGCAKARWSVIRPLMAFMGLVVRWWLLQNAEHPSASIASQLAEAVMSYVLPSGTC
jgi:hypothetical protein